MKVVVINWFENKARNCQIGFNYIEDMSEMDMWPDYVLVENTIEGTDEGDLHTYIYNTHVYAEKPVRDDYDIDERAGFWKVTYKKNNETLHRT